VVSNNCSLSTTFYPQPPHTPTHHNHNQLLYPRTHPCASRQPAHTHPPLWRPPTSTYTPTWYAMASTYRTASTDKMVMRFHCWEGMAAVMASVTSTMTVMAASSVPWRHMGGCLN